MRLLAPSPPVAEGRGGGASHRASLGLPIRDRQKQTRLPVPPTPALPHKEGGRGGGDSFSGERLHSKRGQDELLLLFEQGLKATPGPVLPVEELPVQLGGLLAELLEGDQVVLGCAQGRCQQGRIVRAEGRDW